MTVRDTAWDQGTPCWVDLMTTDPAAAREFYGALFGWQLSVGGPETGGYAMAELDGRSVAGIGGMMGMEHPPVWNTYLATDDADATAAAIEKAGGSIFAPVMDVMDVGRMAIAQVPSGGFFGLWQAGTHTGVGIANVPGTLVWNEFLTRDYEGAMEFYAAVFGYGYTDLGGDAMPYSSIEVAGTTVGGIGAMTAETPAHLPPYWRMYFAASDVDATLAQATGLGGRVVLEAHDSPFGRWATLADPQGAMFSIITPPAPA